MFKTFLLATAFAAVSAWAPAEAQETGVEDGWLPWLGCWRLVDDDVREPLRGDSLGLGKEPVPSSGLVCMTPSPDGAGVTVTTSDGDEVFFEERLVANGEKLPASKGQCVGWQQTDWSADGHRLFTRAELTCEENRKLLVSGLSLMVPPSTWVEMQVVDDGGGARAVVVRRYRPVRRASGDDLVMAALGPELAERAQRARYDATGVLDVDDVLEVIDRTEPEVVEATVLEMQDEGFDLSADALVQLDEAGARAGLIDLMVALSYPDDFLVDREPVPGLSAGDIMAMSYPQPRRLAYPYYLAPFGGYYWYAPYHPSYVVRPSVGSGGYDVGRVVKGQGYTRVQRQAPASGGSHGRGVSSGGYTGGDSGTASSGGGGYRGGSGGGTRTAKPRPK